MIRRSQSFVLAATALTVAAMMAINATDADSSSQNRVGRRLHATASRSRRLQFHGELRALSQSRYQ